MKKLNVLIRRVLDRGLRRVIFHDPAVAGEHFVVLAEAERHARAYPAAAQQHATDHRASQATIQQSEQRAEPQTQVHVAVDFFAVQRFGERPRGLFEQGDGIPPAATAHHALHAQDFQQKPNIRKVEYLFQHNIILTWQCSEPQQMPSSKLSHFHK